MVSETMRKEFAIEGLGIAYVMKQLVQEEIKSGKLLELNLEKANGKAEIGLAMLKEEISSFATKKIVEYIMKTNN